MDEDLHDRLKTILLPLDGSPLAERALPCASALARTSGASIVLVEAVQAPAPPGWNPNVPESATVARAHGGLGDVVNRLRADGVTATAHIAHEAPVAAILDAARLHRADLIVMTTHGRSGLGRVVYGSVADDVLRHAEIPVLLVPARADRAWPGDRPLTVLVPLDGSEWGEAALDALDMLLPVGPSAPALLLLRVIEWPTYPLDVDGYSGGYVDVAFDEEAERTEALSYLGGVAERLAARGYAPSVEVAVGSSATTIAAVAHTRGVDVVAMATHGRGGLARAVLGSVTATTIQRAGVPVLLSRPSELLSARAVGVERADGIGAPVPSGAAPVTVVMNAEERDLVRAGLEQLLAAPAHEGDRAASIRAILARLAPGEPAQPEALAATVR